MPLPIEILLERYADDSATPEERKELMELLREEASDPAVHEWLAGAIEQRPVVHHMDEDAGAGILEAILRTEKVGRVRSLWPRWVAAAVFIGLLGVGVNTFYPHKIKEPVAVNKEIAPGGDRAVLTLGNGDTIVLDSAGNGLIAEQGNMKVEKTLGGQLSYHGEDGGAEAVVYNTLATPRGGQYRLVLPDGSKVWLNAASSIRYPTVFKGAQRDVEISGEVYFEVVTDATRPFIVSSAGQIVQVLGTSFDIRSYADDQIRTTLLEGAVKVSDEGSSSVLRPGQQSVLDPGGKPGMLVRNDADIESVMAWKNGKLAFSKGNIRDLMLEISRWYDVDIKYQGEIPSGGFYGLLDRNVPLANILRVLKAYGVRTRLENKTIIIE